MAYVDCKLILKQSESCSIPTLGPWALVHPRSGSFSNLLFCFPVTCLFQLRELKRWQTLCHCSSQTSFQNSRKRFFKLLKASPECTLTSKTCTSCGRNTESSVCKWASIFERWVLNKILVFSSICLSLDDFRMKTFQQLLLYVDKIQN